MQWNLVNPATNVRRATKLYPCEHYGLVKLKIFHLIVIDFIFEGNRDLTFYSGIFTFFIEQQSVPIAKDTYPG